MGVACAIGLSTLLGLLVSTGVYNFLEELPREVLGRTRPNLFDMVIALAGGTAAAYALAQPHLSAALPGVAIATALMPPICTVGIGLSQGRIDVSGGALLLFLANFTAILFASSLTFALVGFRPVLPARRLAVLAPVLLLEAALVLLIVTVLSGLMVRIISEAQENRVIRATLISALAAQDDSSLVSFERQAQPDYLAIVATIRASSSLTLAEAGQVQRDLAARLQKPVALKFLVIPVTSLDPLAPPPPTASLPPGATAMSTVAPTHTLVPTSVPLPSSTPLPTATRAPTPTVSPPALPTQAAPQYAVIGATGRLGVNVRVAPEAVVFAALRDGTFVQLLERSVMAGGVVWQEVVLPDGRVGWVAAPYLIPYQRFIAP